MSWLLYPEWHRSGFLRQIPVQSRCLQPLSALGLSEVFQPKLMQNLQILFAEPGAFVHGIEAILLFSVSQNQPSVSYSPSRTP